MLFVLFELVFDMMLSLFDCCRRKRISQEDIQYRAKQMLNDWMVTMYANNLQKIPEQRKIRQYELYVEQLSNKY